MRAPILTAALLATLCAGPALAAATDAAAPAAAQSGAATAKVAGVDVVGEGDACLWARSVDGWKAVDRDHVILEAGGNDRYLVHFRGAGVANPAFEFKIGLQSRSSRLCGKAGDHLLIDGERAMIMDVWKVAETRTAAN